MHITMRMGLPGQADERDQNAKQCCRSAARALVRLRVSVVTHGFLGGKSALIFNGEQAASATTFLSHLTYHTTGLAV
jgi:hypothetical protein